MSGVSGPDAPAVAPPPEHADAMLLLGVASGHPPDALDRLYHAYAGRVFGLGLRVLGDRALAEELVQETFVRLWRTAGTFDPDRGTVGAFVLTMARRLSVDLWRRPSSRPFEPEQPEPVETVTARATGDHAEQVSTTVAVTRAMASLSREHREVLELSYRGDLRQADIAAIIGVPLGTVKTRTYYAMRALKLALQERGVDG